MSFYNEEKNVESYISMCEGYDAKDQLELLFETASKGSSLLELGTGPGNDLALLASYYNVVGSDNSLVFLNKLKARFPKNEFLELNASSIKTNKSFDIIYSNKVLHHLDDEEIQISFDRQFQILNSGGYVYHLIWSKIETPEGLEELHFIPRDEAEITELLQSKFEIICIESFGEFEENDSLAVLARKK